MTEATTVATISTTVAIPANVSKDKSAPHPSVFGSSSSSVPAQRKSMFLNGHFTPPAFFKTVRGIEHEQLFTEFNVSAARQFEFELLDKEIEDLKSQLLKAKEESAEVTQLRAQVSGLEATENLLRGEVASAKDHNVLLEQEC
ncbi:hypothetical protein Tco_0244870, partial [Tanacetum coccineum]